MNYKIFLATIAFAASTQIACAQFGSGIVFDPTQSGHAVQQIAQGSRLYTDHSPDDPECDRCLQPGSANGSLPQTLFSSYSNLGRQEWTQLTRPANTYGNSSLWMNAATTGYGAASANQTASFPRTEKTSGYASLDTQGQQAIAAQGATVDLSDSVNASNLQTVGTIRANAAQRETDISQLEAASHSTDPAQHTEMATLQRINQALLIELRTQQETNQMLQAQALQQIVGQKVQQDNLKSLFALGSNYQQDFNAVTPQQSNIGTQWAFHY